MNSNKNLTINNFFSQRRNLISITTIFEYFNLEEVLKFSKLSGSVFKHVKKEKFTTDLVYIKNKYLKFPIFSLNMFEDIIKAINKFESTKNLHVIYEYLAYYVFKYLFKREINITQIKDEHAINLLNYFPQGYFKYEVSLFQLSESKVNPQRLDSILSCDVLPNLLAINMFDNGLSDDVFPILINFINKSKCLNSLVLKQNKIGDSPLGLNFLSSLVRNKTLTNISLDLCSFSSQSISFLKQIFLSNENKIKSLTMYYNNFAIEDVEELFKINLNEESTDRKIGISFYHSPEYNLKSNMREISFGECYLNINPYDENEFYEIYIGDLPFESLAIFKINYSIALESAIDKILMNKNIKSVEVDLGRISNHLTEIILNYLKIKSNVCENLIISENNGNNPNYIFKFSHFLNELQYAGNIKSITINGITAQDDWNKVVMLIVERNQVEKLTYRFCSSLKESDIISLGDLIETKNTLKLVELTSCKNVKNVDFKKFSSSLKKKIRNISIDDILDKVVISISS
jgi:hypothetical protein